MTGKVIQGFFPGGRPKLTAVQPRIAAPPPIQAKTAAPAPATAFAGRPPGPPIPAFAARSSGPPAPAFPSRPATVQRHGAGNAFAIDSGAVGLASGGGKPLPEAVRGKMEAALGADFSNVRVHVGPQAERIGAIAFTVGSDIYFAPGRYQPDTVHGQQLLGHELAHVVQQRAGRVRNPLGSGLAVVRDHALEAEADRLGRHASAEPGIAPPAAVQRMAKPPVAGAPRPPAPRPAASVIQRIGEEEFDYEKSSLPLTTPDREKLEHLTAILLNIIETLGLRASLWKRAKEKQLSATLTTLTDVQKVKKIKDALAGYDYPVPVTTDLATLKLDPNVIELFDISPRLKREVDWVEPADRHATIMSHANTVDAPVMTAPLPSRVFDFATVKADPILKTLMKQNDLDWANASGKDHIRTASGIILITFYHKDEAFVRKPHQPTGVAREIFVKRGKSEGQRNEYVKDDKGVFTRRFAYVEKNKYQFRDLANRQLLAGRYPTLQSERYCRPQPYNQIDKFATKQVPSLPRAATFSDAYQLAYLHQELGSGHQQRGVSATSSPKHDIFSNAGESFRTEDGVRIEVDLARVPQGTNTAPQLINHYAASAREKMRPVIGTYTVKGRPFSHYQWSVKKNRELFIKELRPQYVTSLTLHQTATGTSHQEVKPTGFTSGDITALGERVGLSVYNAGFLAGSLGSRSAVASQPAEKQRYYSAGYSDGQEYATGYSAGSAKRRCPLDKSGIPRGTLEEVKAKLKDDKKVRYTQGFWDGYYQRPKRTN